MKTFKDIDELVAEKVMGWNVTNYRNINVVEAITEDEEVLIIGEDFKPSTDITNAFAVLNKFDCGYCIEKFGDEFEVSIYQSYDPTEIRLGRKIIKRSNSLPLAICKAALQSVEVEVTV